MNSLTDLSPAQREAFLTEAAELVERSIEKAAVDVLAELVARHPISKALACQIIRAALIRIPDQQLGNAIAAGCA